MKSKSHYGHTLDSGVRFQARIGLLEICVGTFILISSAGILMKLYPNTMGRSELFRGAFFVALLAYWLGFIKSIRPRIENLTDHFKFPKLELTLSIFFGVVIVLFSVFFGYWVTHHGLQIEKMFLGLPLIILGCIYLMFMGFVARTNRLIVYSHFWLLITVLWTSRIMDFHEIFYIVLPFSLLVFTIGIVNFIEFVKEHPITTANK